MALANGARGLDSMEALYMFVDQFEQFNKESLKKGNHGYGFFFLRGWY